MRCNDVTNAIPTGGGSVSDFATIYFGKRREVRGNDAGADDRQPREERGRRRRAEPARPGLNIGSTSMIDTS